MNLLDKYIFSKYGAKVTNAKEGLETSVGTTAVQLFRKNPNRVGFIVINLSTNTLYLGFGPNTTATRGIVLDPNGGQASSWIDEDAHLTQKEWWIIASGAGSALYAFEVEAIA